MHQSGASEGRNKIVHQCFYDEFFVIFPAVRDETKKCTRGGETMDSSSLRLKFNGARPG